jgi:hypothetical protein
VWYAIVVDPAVFLRRLFAPLTTREWWPHVRAVLVLLHVVAVLAVACPAPVRTPDAKGWKRPTVQGELRMWSNTLKGIGIEQTPAQLQAFAMATTTSWLDYRSTAVKPFQTWLRSVGAPQGWYMFTGPDREPQRFMLAFTTRSSKQLQPVFALADDVAAPELVAPGFVHDHRVRRALFQSSWSKNANTFRSVCRFFDRHLRAKRDDVRDVRCSLEARAVEHPARRDEVRRSHIVRSLTLRADGSSVEDNEDQKPIRKPATVKP